MFYSGNIRHNNSRNLLLIQGKTLEICEKGMCSFENETCLMLPPSPNTPIYYVDGHAFFFFFHQMPNEVLSHLPVPLRQLSNWEERAIH